LGPEQDQIRRRRGRLAVRALEPSVAEPVLRGPTSVQRARARDPEPLWQPSATLSANRL